MSTATLESPSLDTIEETLQAALVHGDGDRAREWLREGTHQARGEEHKYALVIECAVETGQLGKIPVSWLREVGQGRPEPVQAILLLAERYRKEGRPEKGTEVATLVTEVDPWHAPGWFERACCAKDLDDNRWAVYFAHRALAVDRDFTPAKKMINQLDSICSGEKSIDGMLKRAADHLEEGERDEAANLIARSIRYYPPKEWAQVILDLMESSSWETPLFTE